MEEEKSISNGKLFFIIFILLIISTVLWARFISTKGLIVKEYPVYNTNITDNFDGLKIVQFSDLLYGRTVNKSDVDKLVTKINELKPDIVVFTGNLFDKDTIVSNNLKNDIDKKLSKIDAKLYKFAIYGNLDKKIDNYDILMKNAGFTVLSNSSELVYYNGTTPIFVGGLDSMLANSMDVDTTLSPLKEEQYQNCYKIVIAHEPDSYDKFKDYNVDLVLSGHSLNGQVRVPFVGAIKNKKGSLKYNNAYYKIGNTDMYISGGIGTSNYSFRWFNKPSINLYRLYKK